MAGPVAIVLKGYPRLSETFIAQEIRALEQLGLRMTIVSLRRPTDPAVHPVHREIRAPVLYLPEYVYEEPLRVLRGLLRALRCRGFAAALRIWLRDLLRDPTPNRGRRFAQALVLAAELPAEIEHLHVHYLHTPASVGRYAALMRGISWSLSAHAKDIWITRDWEKREKLASCRWAVTCSRAGLEALARFAPEGRIELLYHGLDLRRFPPPGRRAGGDGSERCRPVVIVSVARMVPKKGLDVLLRALARVPRALHWRFLHIGSGPEEHRLRALARELGITRRVRFLGAADQRRVLALLRRGEIFALPARVAADGDRDGLPNVLLEAASQELAIVTTPVSAIPEFVHTGTGLLVPPDDPGALAEALVALIRDPQERIRLGRAARSELEARFAMEAGIRRLARKFGLRLREPAAA